MKIINVDAYHFEHRWMKKDVKVASEEKLGIIEFVLDVVKPIERGYYRHMANDYLRFLHPICDFKGSLPLSPTWKLESFCYESVAIFLHTLPIYLRASRPVEKQDCPCIIDLLGAYFPSHKGSSPYIELYMDAIDDASQNNDEQFKWLFTKVLLHELAHATLDVYNTEHGLLKIRYADLYNTEFGRWVEESMANAIALKIIKAYGSVDFYNYSKQFIKSQPAEYALGVLMEDFTNEDFGSLIVAKIQGVVPERQEEWLKYAKHNPDSIGLHKWCHLFFCHHIKLFENEWYSTTQELVTAIVNKVLTDYKKSHQSLMSYQEFCSYFPQKDSKGEPYYSKADEAEEDRRHLVEIKLKDAICYIYNLSEETINSFVEKSISM